MRLSGWGKKGREGERVFVVFVSGFRRANYTICCDPARTATPTLCHGHFAVDIFTLIQHFHFHSRFHSASGRSEGILCVAAFYMPIPQLSTAQFALPLYLCPLPSSWLALFASVSDRTPPSDIIHTRAREPKSLRVAVIFTILPLFPLLLFVLHLSLFFLFFTLCCHC